MAAIRFVDVQARPIEFLDLTSLTLEEFEQLIEPFEDAFQAHMRLWRLKGKPRASRQLPCTKAARCPHRRIACSSC
jgi:hypothetical protein